MEHAHFRAAYLNFCSRRAFVEFGQGEVTQARLSLTIFQESGYSIPCMARVLGQLIAMFSNVGRLSICGSGDEELDDTDWLPLLYSFPAVETLVISARFVGHIVSALQDIPEERATEVFPVLNSLCLDDGNLPVKPPEQFLSLRRLSRHPAP